MKATGSFDTSELRTLLETAQTERATGTLSLSENGRACTLYFLFGHLFHAVADGGTTGDEAVMAALVWPAAGDFSFDAKAKLPADETVRSTIPELLARAESARSASGAATASSSAEATFSPPGPGRPQESPEPLEAAHRTPTPHDSSPPLVGEASPFRPPTLASSDETAAQPPDPHLEPEGQADRRLGPPPLAEPPVAFAPPSPRRAEPPSEPRMEPPQPRRGVKHRPEPKGAREPVPVPAGQLIYDSLKTSFVDFPRVITTLEKEGYTGYIRLLTEDSSGLIFFREGSALECVYDNGTDVTLGKPALAALNEDVNRGNGVLDVVALSSELVDGLYQLTVARPMYTELYASWVNIRGLLDFLRGRKLTGVVTARSRANTGVIILTEGEVIGSYTIESRDISPDVESVLALCSDPEAMIEVKAASAGNSPALDVAEVVGPPGRPASYAAPQAAPPPPPPPAGPPSAAAQSAPTLGVPPLGATQALPAVPPPPAPTPAGGAPESASWPTGPQVMPAVQAPGTPQAGAGGADWEGVITDLQAMAEEALGNRSRKVKDILAAADRSAAGVGDAINQIPTISLLFVDSSRLEALAAEMRAKVQGLR